jgi:hypothetical protein
MMMAVRQREGTAETTFEWTRSLVLATSHCSSALDVRPWCADLASTATIEVGVEADVLCRERKHNRSIGGNAQTIGGCLYSTECPAATAITLVANVADDLRTLWPVLLRVEAIWSNCISISLMSHKFSTGKAICDRLLVIAQDTVHVLERTWSCRGEAWMSGCFPHDTSCLLNLFDLSCALWVNSLRWSTLDLDAEELVTI